MARSTTYAYSDNYYPAGQDGYHRWSFLVWSAMDGFGRTTATVTGYSVHGQPNTTISTVDTQYAPCGCSPLGKLSQQSQPYGPSGTDAWGDRLYHYDASPAEPPALCYQTAAAQQLTCTRAIPSPSPIPPANGRRSPWKCLRQPGNRARAGPDTRNRHHELHLRRPQSSDNRVDATWDNLWNAKPARSTTTQAQL